MRDIMPMSLRTKLSVGVLAIIILACLAAGIQVINDMNQQISATVAAKAKSDLATALQIIDYMHPGPWHIEDGVLYKGATRINDNDALVDNIRNLTNDTVTVFLGDTRVTTNVFLDDQRAVGTKAADYVTESVLHQGQLYLGEADVVGSTYQTCYAPIRDKDDDIIGMFYVGVSHQMANQLQHTFTAVTVLSARISLLFALAATCFIPVDAWSPPPATRPSSRITATLFHRFATTRWTSGSRRQENEN